MQMPWLTASIITMAHFVVAVWIRWDLWDYSRTGKDVCVNVRNDVWRLIIIIGTSGMCRWYYCFRYVTSESYNAYYSLQIEITINSMS